MLTETAAVKLKPEALLEGEMSVSVTESLAKRLSERGFEAKKRCAFCSDFGCFVLWISCFSYFALSRDARWSWCVSQVLHSSYVKGGLALGALLGPGRDLLVDGLRAFKKGSPNMNSLVGFGSVVAFIISISLLSPELEWDASFFEEPVTCLLSAFAFSSQSFCFMFFNCMRKVLNLPN
ncbi:hypothetical protein Peur_008959 [Populus x canadensis]